MSDAWEVTEEDVEIVLEKHESDKKTSDVFDDVDADEVENAVLNYTDFDEQCNAALAEIENQLIMAGHLESPKRFDFPE